VNENIFTPPYKNCFLNKHSPFFAAAINGGNVLNGGFIRCI